MTITYISRKYLQQKVKKRNSQHRRLTFTIISIFATILLASGYYAGSTELGKLYDQLPTVASIKSKFSLRTENSFIYDRQGTLLYTFKNANIDREYLEADEITDTIKLAILSAEDKDFFIHHGIDYIATAKGFVDSLGSDSEKIAGGSTITQQLAKNTFLSRERSFERKAKEALLSLVIESNYTKDQILEYYLNTVTFGSRVTGLKTAARVYFSKSVDKLNFNEVAFLISIVQNPNEMSPIYSFDQQKAWVLNNARRGYIIDQALKNYDYFSSVLKTIPSKEELNKYSTTGIALQPTVSDIKAPHFVFYIQSILENEPYNITPDQLYTGGYKIYTSLDYSMQQVAEQEILPATNQIGPNYGFSNSALITIDPQNGDILVMQGSKSYWEPKTGNGRFDPQVNVTLSPQNLGSSLKPILTALAFEAKLYTRSSIVQDTPQTFPGGYQPKDVDGRFLGAITLDQAIKYSRNLPFVKMLNQLGISRFVNLLKDLGYSNAIKGADYGLSAALGGVSETLLDHAYAYGALATSGIKVKPRPILSIVSIKTGETREFGTETSRVLSINATNQVNKIIGDKTYRADNHWMVYPQPGYKFAGKTGTTDRNKQNYYVGYSPKILTAVWVGNNNNDELSGKSFGSTTALPIWYRYMKRLLAEHPDYISWGSY